jgi:hypothetical protein
MDTLATTPGGGAKGGGAKGGGGFVMPREPPTKEQWVPDSEADMCMVCKREHFGMVSSLAGIFEMNKFQNLKC